MSTLGKVLLVINLLAAAGVVYLASQSFGKRDEQNTALVKFELVSSGVPFDGEKTFVTAPDQVVKLPVVLGSGRTLTTIKGKVLLDVFQGAVHAGDLQNSQTGPPLSVVAEIEEIKKQIDAKVNSFAANPAGGLGWLVGTVSGQTGRFVPGLLTLLSDDFEERTIFRTWLDRGAEQQNAEAKKYYDLAVAALNKKFHQATVAANPGEAINSLTARANARTALSDAFQDWSKAKIEQINPANIKLQQAYDDYWKASTALSAPSSEVERRRVASALLLHTDNSPTGQKRSALILGLPAYTKALNDRLNRLAETPSQLRDAKQRELLTFVVLYERDLQASRDLDKLVTTQKNTTATLVAAAQEAKKNLAQHTKLLEDAITRTEDVLAKVRARSTEQAELERELFGLQQTVGTLLSETFELEDRVIEAERKRIKK
jgi:hypothetical protein